MCGDIAVAFPGKTRVLEGIAGSWRAGASAPDRENAVVLIHGSYPAQASSAYVLIPPRVGQIAVRQRPGCVTGPVRQKPVPVRQLRLHTIIVCSVSRQARVGKRGCVGREPAKDIDGPTSSIRVRRQSIR